MAIQILKLRCGDEIIGDFTSNGDTPSFIEKPLKIMIVPVDDHGNMGLMLIPWMPYTDDKKIEIKNEVIDIIVNPSTDMKNNYNEQFGTGIVTPPKSDIII